MENEISRREFIGSAAGASMLASAAEAKELKPLIKPKALRSGDTIGLVTPASPVFAPADIREGVKTMESLGFRVKLGKHLNRKWGYLAGSDLERSQDLMDLFVDPEVAGIIALRGGYGTIRILPHLDYDLLRKNAKILIGYSDLTSLLLAVHKLAGIVTFHGTVALSTFNEYSTRYFKKTLMQAQPVGPVEDAPANSAVVLANGAQPGQVRGALVGGNLTLVCASLATPYEIDTRDKVLFLEEVGEEPYAVDRMLTQLDQAGKLQECRAILLDRCAKCVPAEYKPAFYNTFSVEEIIMERLGRLNVPVLYGLSLGHVADKPVLPLGIEVMVDTQAGRFEIIQPAVG